MIVSPYLLTIAIGWAVAQGAKYLIAAIESRDFGQLNRLYLSGNMPSAHSATTVALMTYVGLQDGTDSSMFAIAALLASIVMYDAVMVRRSVGEQGLAIQNLIKIAKNKRVEIPRSAKGHTPLEVLVGAIVGLAIGTIVFFATT